MQLLLIIAMLHHSIKDLVTVAQENSTNQIAVLVQLYMEWKVHKSYCRTEHTLPNSNSSKEFRNNKSSMCVFGCDDTYSFSPI